MNATGQKNGCVPQLDPREYFFGYGRRICSGMDLAQATAWMMMACILASFEIRLQASQGEFKPEFTYDGLIR